MRYPRRVRAFAAILVSVGAVLGALAGCRGSGSAVSAPAPVSAVPYQQTASRPATAIPAPPTASPVPAPAATLRPIADEGAVTYSVTLRPGQCHARDAGTLPDPACTPGSIDPHVTQATIGVTICLPGWTATVRPPAAQTTRAKYRVSYPAYGLPRATGTEEDHSVSLELGGSNDILNLWPESYPEARVKDVVENALRAAVCNGRTSLAAAQMAIASNWKTARQRLGLPS